MGTEPERGGGGGLVGWILVGDLMGRNLHVVCFVGWHRETFS